MRTPIIIALLFLFSANAFSRILKVGQHQPFQNINSAVAAADSGDVILISSGIYNEGNIIINKPISIEGHGKVIVDGLKQSDVFSVTCNHVSITGITICNSGRSDIKEEAGISLNQSKFCSVQYCILLNNFFGIYCANTASCTFNNNEIINNTLTESSGGNGIHLWHCDSMIITNNVVKSCRDGIYFEFVSHSFISGNVSTLQLRYGIHFMFSDHDEYSNNIFYNNGSGVAVMYSNHVNIHNNTFYYNKGGAAYGILLKEITDSHINSNLFEQNTNGIYMEGTSRCLLQKNTLRSNGWALRLLGDCADDTLCLNNFFANTMDVSTNSNSSDHLFYRNYWDKYSGYDLNKDGFGDVFYHPVSLFSKLSEIVPNSVMLLHSFLIDLLEQAEALIPSITPDSFVDDEPSMKPISI